MKLKSLSKLLIGCALILLTACAANEQKPNIVILLADDAGYADFGFMGSKDLPTPNIDRIAKQGAMFTDFHVSGSVCAPSRAGLMTGRYQHRFGAEFNNHPDGIGVPVSEQMIAEMLKAEGYKTAAYGKWHLGHIEECHPNNRGFDEFYGFISGHRSYFCDASYDKKPNDKAMQLNGEHTAFDGYLTDELGWKAIDFIKANKENPFFVYLSYNAVHTPLQAPEEDLALYEGHPRQMLAAMTHALDRSVGEVLNTLDEEKILDNTLVIFLSDNGGPSSNQSSNGPLKGQKGTEFEGGHRVACAMMWEGKIIAGNEFHQLASSLDLMPTIKSAAGIATEQQLPFDGVDLIPYLDGSQKGAPHESLFWRIAPWAAARVNEYKLVDADTFAVGLYNLNEDLGEVNNLSEEQADKLREITKSLNEWEAELPPSRGNREGAWEEVKAYMYMDYINNQAIRFKGPSELKKFKKQNSIK